MKKSVTPREDNALFTTIDANPLAENALFERLQARFSGLGHRLTRTIEPDGTLTYFVGCGSFSREVAGIDAAGRFLKTIGGAL